MAKAQAREAERGRVSRRGRKPQRRVARVEDTHSGDLSVPLVEVPPSARISHAVARVAGGPFHGRVRDLAGTRVTASRVTYNSDGVLGPPEHGEAAFIVDFGGSRSIIAVAMTDGSEILLLLPWLGTDFSPRPAWPVGDAPLPDATGDATVDLTGIETSKLFVQIAQSEESLNEAGLAAACRITTATPPSNLRAAVGDRPPFWTHPGVLTDEVEITGLAAELGALASSSPGLAELTISTDTPGVLTVDFDAQRDVSLSQTAEARWAGKGSTSVAVPALAAVPVALPFPTDASGTWSLQGVELELAGSFPRWRAFTVGTDDTPGRLSMKVDARFAVARCVPLDAATTVYGFSLLVAGGGELHLELVPDPDAARPIAAVDVSVDGASPSWLDVLLPSPVDVDAGSPWLVAKAKTGTIEWIGTTVPDAAAGPSTLALVSSEGGRWERYPALGAVTPTTQVRVLRLPAPTDNAPLLTLAWPDGLGDAVGVDVDGDTTTVQLLRLASDPLTVTAAGGTATVEVLATACATGTLVIKRATAIFGPG